jgi:hypothetical protein
VGPISEPSGLARRGREGALAAALNHSSEVTKIGRPPARVGTSSEPTNGTRFGLTGSGVGGIQPAAKGAPLWHTSLLRRS